MPAPAQFCPKGHDTHAVGRDAGGCCRQCRRDTRMRCYRANPGREAAYQRDYHRLLREHGINPRSKRQKETPK